MSDISQQYELAHDAEFRLHSRFALPPRPGKIKTKEANGSYTVEVDDQDGGAVTAWPLNGFVHAVDDIVYIAYASNTSDSAIILGSHTPAPDISIVDITGDNVRVQTSQTPATAAAAGQQGEIAWDANYLYVCIAANTWKRAGLSTW
jgi:hypothetical protein